MRQLNYLDDGTLLLFIVTMGISYVIYTIYLVWKHKAKMSEGKERKISTFILVIIFFVLSVMYEYYWGNHLFIMIWFLYALWNLRRETKKLICSRRDRRRTDKRSDEKCLMCL